MIVDLFNVLTRRSVLEHYITNGLVPAVKFTYGALSRMLLDRFKQDVEGKDTTDFSQMVDKMREFSKDLRK